jgi:Holliday junction resolvase
MPSEKEVEHIHRPFIKWLKERGIPYVNARSDVPSTIAKGHPDFVIGVNGRCLYIEVKTSSGKLSKEQIEYIEFLRSVNNPVIVCRSLEECVTAVQSWLNLMPAISAPAKEVPKDELRLMQWKHGITLVVRPDRDGFTTVRQATPTDLRTLRHI